MGRWRRSRSTISNSRRPPNNLSRSWCMVTCDGLWVPSQGPKATSHLGRCASDGQVAGDGAWWQFASPGHFLVVMGEPHSGHGERPVLRGKRWFVLLGAALRWC